MSVATAETEYADDIPDGWEDAEVLSDDDVHHDVDQTYAGDVGNADPEAPYGRKADGTPKRKPGPQKKAGSTAVPRAPRPAARATRKPAATRVASRGPVDYTDTITGVLQLFAIPLGLAGRAKIEYAYDAAALTAFAPGIAEFGNEAAQNEPRIAALLDKVMMIGPYGKGLALALGLGAQLMVNHKVIPLEVGGPMGAMAPDKLMDLVANG